MPTHARAAHRFPAPEGWLEYADWRGEAGTVAGRVLVWPEIASARLGNRRHVLVHVPPSLDHAAPHGPHRRYPVLYFHDGQNLFDEGTSAYGEWRTDEVLLALAREGVEAIVVAVPNAEDAVPKGAQQRPDEYSPYREDGVGGNAEDYLSLVADAVKPLVDAAFPTRPEPRATGLAGSSLGGLISLYGLIARPDTFGFAGVMSPALVFGGGRALKEIVPALRPGPRLYVDVGGYEGSFARTPAQQARISERYLADARRLREHLLANGFVDGDDLCYVEAPEAIHHESAWAERSPGMLRFLLRPWAA